MILSFLYNIYIIIYYNISSIQPQAIHTKQKRTQIHKYTSTDTQTHTHTHTHCTYKYISIITIIDNYYRNA